MLVQSEPPRRTFTTAAVPRCTVCGAERVFECQLMPNLINVTRAAASAGPERKPPTDEERRQEVRAVLAGEGERSGMGWGTCMVFSCEKDCRGKDGTAKEIWTEESVFVQWED
jgi:pre-rRNA-processing protein TSR4